MTVEDQLRAVMTAHDVEAPSRVPWPAAEVAVTRHRPSSRVLLAAALVAVLVAGGTWLLVAWPRASHTSTPVSPLSCPADHPAHPGGDDVPARPSVPGADTQLVPDETPESVVVCGYVLGGTPGPRNAPQPRSGQAVLTGDLGLVTDQLRNLPRDTGNGMCPLSSAATDDDDYLIGLSYPDGTVWVSAPGDHCAGSGNGAFSTSVNLRGPAATWLADGHPSAAQVVDPGIVNTGQLPGYLGCGTAAGHLGQDEAMVPGDPTSLSICVGGGRDDARTVPIGPTDLGRVVSTLDAIPAVPRVLRTDGCIPAPGTDLTVYVLLFGYSDGPGVQIVVQSGCPDNIRNGALEASDTSTLLPLLQSLTR